MGYTQYVGVQHGVQNTVFPPEIAGDSDRAAIFLGSTTPERMVEELIQRFQVRGIARYLLLPRAGRPWRREVRLFKRC